MRVITTSAVPWRACALHTNGVELREAVGGARRVAAKRIGDSLGDRDLVTSVTIPITKGQ